MKKTLALVLALVLALGMTVTAFADTTAQLTTSTADITQDDETKESGSLKGTTIKIGSMLFYPTIEVVIQKPSMVALNPYNMTVDVSTAIKSDFTAKTESVISVPSLVTNKSSVEVEVTVKATGSGGAEFVKTQTELGQKDGAAIYAGIELKKATAASNTPAVTAAGLSDWATNASTLASKSDAAIIGDDNSSTSITLPAKDVSTPETPQYYFGAYQVVGECNKHAWQTVNTSINISAVFTVTVKTGGTPAA